MPPFPTRTRYAPRALALRSAVLVACFALAGLAAVASEPVGIDATVSRYANAHDLDCTACHVPALALPGDREQEWATAWAPDELARSFRMYTTSAGNTGTVEGSSYLCLSCHDGITAADDYGGRMGAVTARAGAPSLGQDLRDDHPIGIAYPPRDSRGMLLDGYRPQPQGDLLLERIDGVPRVECVSCHDPHGSPYPMMLREPTVGSAICFGCHDL